MVERFPPHRPAARRRPGTLIGLLSDSSAMHSSSSLLQKARTSASSTRRRRLMQERDSCAIHARQLHWRG